MPTLTVSQFSLVYNALSFVFAAMLAAFVFFILSRQNIAPQLRNALTMSALVVVVAGYHYFRIFESWNAAYILKDGVYTASGQPFNDAYRYIDWLLTVPLLVAELIASLGLSRKVGGNLTARLAVAAALMVALGYPGEIAADNTTRLIWGVLSTLPFLYIVYTLFTELGRSTTSQPAEVKALFGRARLLMLATWGFYPIVYSLKYFGNLNADVVIAVQIGYCIADVLAKAGFGVMIYMIARAKTEAEAPVGSTVTATAAAH